MRKAHLVAQRMPRVTDILPEAARHSHHDGRAEAIRRPPAQRTAIVELLGGRIGILAKLDLSDGNEASDRHPHRPPDDALLGQTRVEDPSLAEPLLKSLGDEVHAALFPDVFPEHEELWIHRELVTQRAPHRV